MEWYFIVIITLGINGIIFWILNATDEDKSFLWAASYVFWICWVLTIPLRKYQLLLCYEICTVDDGISHYIRGGHKARQFINYKKEQGGRVSCFTITLKEYILFKYFNKREN